MGTQLRQTILINDMLFNSEACHSVTTMDIKSLEKLDESLLRFLLGSHANTPIEMLFLDSGATPIAHVISSLRMIYLQTLLKREDEELTKRILRAQISDACPGDFYKLVESDFEAIEITFDLNFVENAGV